MKYLFFSHSMRCRSEKFSQEPAFGEHQCKCSRIPHLEIKRQREPDFGSTAVILNLMPYARTKERNWPCWVPGKHTFRFPAKSLGSGAVSLRRKTELISKVLDFERCIHSGYDTAQLFTELSN